MRRLRVFTLVILILILALWGSSGCWGHRAEVVVYGPLWMDNGWSRYP